MATFNASRLAALRVAVLAGGNSPERPISLASGQAVSAALASRGHIVVDLDPADVDLACYSWEGIDAAFLALHGPFGEDGQVQQILEAAGIPFTGSDSVTSQLAFSKSASKERFLQQGVSTPSYVLIHESDDAARMQQHARMLGYPLAVKPDGQGSSLGVSIVHSPDELAQALTRCFHYDSFGILEAAIPGTEWTLGLLDDEPLPLIQIQTPHAFFDYQAKYEDEATQYVFEFDLPGNVVQAIETAGRRACEALGTRGLVRVDIRVDRLHRPWILEVNTIPGLTDHSLVPKAAARAGIDFAMLCELAVQRCLASAVARPHS